MPTTESVIKMLNKRLSDFYDFFGYRSPEYNEIKTIVFQNFRGSDDMILKQKGRAPRISRSKAHMQQYNSNQALQSNLQSIYDKVMEIGTVRKVAESYADTLEKQGINVTGNGLFTMRKGWEHVEDFRKLARSNYAAQFNDDDYYKYMNEAISTTFDELYLKDLEELNNKFHEKPGNGNPLGMDKKWDEIEEFYKQAKKKHEERIANGEVPPDADTNDPLDMGVNV